MKFAHLAAACSIAFATPLALSQPAPAPTTQQKQAAMAVSHVLGLATLKSGPLSLAAPGHPFDHYVKSLDPERMVFTAADIEELKPQRENVDRLDKGADFELSFAVHHLFVDRLATRIAYANSLLRAPMNLATSARYQRVRSKAPWASSSEQLHALWQQRVADDFIKLSLAGRSEKSIPAILERRYNRLLSDARSRNGNELFTQYINGFARAYDPSASYYPAQAEPAAPSASGLVGVGMVVQIRADRVFIRELARGGPGLRSGQLQVGDRIVAVGEGAHGPMVDVMGWRVDEAVALLRGPAGSSVVLEVLAAGARPGAGTKRVTLLREKFELLPDLATSCVEEVTLDGAAYRIGIITIPSFYLDFDAKRRGVKDYGSVARDVAAQLASLKIRKADAVLLDVRGNGGGSFAEVVDAVGLFVPDSPVLQQRERSNALSVERSPKGLASWDGLLGVLTDNSSASGTEIFAAALQDHGRAIIIGDITYGRGTVQSVVSLNRLARIDTEQGDVGDLGLTVSQVFRVDGSTFHLDGMRPDIHVPGMQNAIGHGAGYHAFRINAVKALEYRRHGNLNQLIARLSGRHATRTAGDAGYQELLAATAREQARTASDEVSLNLAERRALETAAPAPNVRQVQLDAALRIMGDAVAQVRSQPALATQAGVVAGPR